MPEDRLPNLERELGVDLTARPETLSPDEFVRLSRLVAANRASF